MRRPVILCAVAGMALLTAGCPKPQANSDYHAGKKAEAVQDYDTALVDYQRALRSDPENIEYKVNVSHMRFVDAQFHVDQGKKLLAKGDLQGALSEFEKGEAIDPSNESAQQLTQNTMKMLAEKSAAEAPKVPVSPEEAEVIGGPPELKPLSREPINLKMTNDAKIIYETIGKLAGLSVIFDPDFTSRRITADLPNVTLEQALDAVSLESKAFWKPVTNNIIFIAPDQPQKRKDIEDEVVRTFYLHNTLTPQDLTEIVTGLRQLLDLKRLQQVNSQNAIVVRDTPDKILLASKIIRDIDKAKPEVLLHVQVLQTRLDRLRDLGILPGQTASLAFTPRTALQPSSTTSSTTGTGTTGTGTTGTGTGTSTGTPGTSVALNNLRHIGTADYSLTLPGAQANAVLTDSSTRIIQDPEIRISDGEQAKLRIGDRVPIATGSFQAGVGVGATAGTGLINPLVNTQFQYLDVGVNIDVTPRVHPEGDVSLKLIVDVSSVTGEQNIGGIQQPVISQRKIEHEVRLKEGEANVLGGLIDRTESKTLNGWPGLAKIPFFRYFFSEDTKEITDDEVMIMITPHIIRLPAITAENLKSYAAGTDTNVRVYRDENPNTVALDGNGSAPPSPGAQAASETTPPPPGTPRSAVQLHFNPANVTLKPGDTATVGLQVENATDLFSIPLMLQYNPAVIQVEEARNGGFLAGSTNQDIAIVQRVDQDHGQVIVSASRQPNTPGINGTGTLLGFVVKGVAPGDAHLQIVQVNAKDSQQKPIPMISGEANIHVQ